MCRTGSWQKRGALFRTNCKRLIAGGFDGADLSKALRLPAGEVPALLLALGHCADRQGGRRRKAMNSMREDR
jgi:hypothetical protein